MVRNSVSDEGKKPAVTAANVMRWLLFLCAVLFFCPSFFVSCSGKDVKVSAMTAVKGVSMYGDQVVDPHPVMLVCLLLPVAALALLYLKKFSDQATAGLAAACMVVDFIVWLVFRSAVKKIADENYCDFRTSAWYAINLAAQLLVIFLSLLVAVRKMEMDMDVVSFFASGGARGNQTMFCGACGTENADGAKFCTGCGQPLAQTGGAEKKAGPEEPEKAVFEITEAGKPQMIGERKPVPKKILAVAALAAVALAAVLWFAVRAGSTVNLDEYLTVETDGYDGYGTAKAEIDWDMLEKNCGGKVSFTEKAKSEYGGFTNMMSPAELMREYVRVELDRSDHLSNGDKIAYIWKVDDDFSKYLKCKLKYKDGTHGVSDLEEVGTFDAFADLEVTFSGVGPNGSADFEYKGTKLDEYDFSCDKDSGLSNGDTVTVSISDENLSDYAERLGKVPETLEKEYKVEGLNSYLTSTSEIGEEDLKAMQRQALDVFHAYVARDWADTTKLESFDYVGTYFLTAKNPDTVEGRQNALFLVYKIQARNTYSNGEETFDKTSDVYWYLSYSDLLAGADGRLAMDLSDYGTPNESYVVDSGISEGWFGTHSWYYDGYGTLDELYKDVVTSNADEYNHEDHVDGSASSEASGESADEGDGTAYILPDSDTKLLLEKDLEELSDEECKLARNEIYARHGRKFKDEKLQAYFDARDWYEGTIEPDDFEESLLSEVEIANRDLLVAYEEKRK